MQLQLPAGVWQVPLAAQGLWRPLELLALLLPASLQLLPLSAQVSLEIDDRADRPSIIKISADMVRIEITGAVTAPETNELILEFMRSLLTVRLSQLSIIRGESTRHKLLMVTKLKPEEAYQKLQAALAIRNEAPTRRER